MFVLDCLKIGLKHFLAWKILQNKNFNLTRVEHACCSLSAVCKITKLGITEKHVCFLSVNSS